MRSKKKIIIILFFLFNIFGSMFFSWPVAAIEEKAHVDSLVAQYFNFLFSGNINGLKNISTGKALLSIERLAKNPGYSEFLKNYYENAECNIVNHKITSNKKVAVTVKITKAGGIENDFIVYVIRDNSNENSDQQMKIEDSKRL